MDRLHAALLPFAKKHVWNIKYGLLHYPQFVAPDDVVRYLAANLHGISTVLDLGCGRGSMLRALREKGWAGNYCGVDISGRAVDAARKSADQRSSWVVSDFESFVSPFQWDVIAMVESLYYVKLHGLPEFLQKKIAMLSENGFVLFRLHDLHKYNDYVEAVYGLYPQTEKVAEHLFRIPAPARAAV